MPGTTPAASQLDWLISSTTTMVLFCSKVIRERLRSSTWVMGAPPSVSHNDNGARPLPPSSCHRTKPTICLGLSTDVNRPEATCNDIPPDIHAPDSIGDCD